MSRTGALLVAVDLVAPALVPRPLRGLYARTVGAAAAAVLAAWEAAADAWDEAEDEQDTA